MRQFRDLPPGVREWPGIGTMPAVQADWLIGDGPDAERRRFVVCGDNPLTLRLVDELVTRYGAEVVVVLPSARAGRGPELARLPGVRMVEAERPNADAFQQADLAGAAALALVNQDDAGNLDAALLARELNGALRIVVRMYNANLGAGVRHLLGDCEVLSESAIAAPAFVAPALGDAVPAFLRVPGQPVFVARRDAVPATDVLCGIAVTGGREDAELLPADQDRADVVIACSELPAPGPVHRPRRRLRVFALLIGRRLRSIVGILAALLAVGTAILMWAKHIGWWRAAYLTVLSTFGAGDPEPEAAVAVQVVGVALTVVSIALVPVLTAAIVDAVVNARLRLASGGLVEAVEGHVVVVGLGNLASRIVQALHDLGLTVVAVGADERARGVALARSLQVPVVLGNPTQEQVLRSASVATCRALVVASSDDVNNLETALLARSLNPDARIVLRLFDGDFAERVQRNFYLTRGAPGGGAEPAARDPAARHPYRPGGPDPVVPARRPQAAADRPADRAVHPGRAQPAHGRDHRRGDVQPVDRVLTRRYFADSTSTTNRMGPLVGSLPSPYPRFEGMSSCTRLPTFTPTRPWSQPLITCPPPRDRENVWLFFQDASNSPPVLYETPT
ncbi:MAG: hypothetical protein AUI10_03450 [Actinobacteria bacterium 13_2_20CM_2_72_6]|nr:MAG: hypothetical protein AUI10_03450 [Actinobacteria bacterium 13_2_20CM_2_72_6]